MADEKEGQAQPQPQPQSTPQKQPQMFNLVIGLKSGSCPRLVWQDEEGMKVEWKEEILFVTDGNHEVEAQIPRENVAFVCYNMLLFPNPEDIFPTK